MTQKQTIVEHLKAGKSITQLEATHKYRITRLASIIHALRREDNLPIKTRDRIAKESNNVYVEYYLDAIGQQDDSPGLFSELYPPVQMSDSLDISDTPLTPIPHDKPKEESGMEIRAYHVANPGDTAQILESFRAYCETFGGKRVEITADWSRQLLKLNRDFSASSEQMRNRDIKARKLADFKEHFRNGTFLYTNVGIGFDEDGWLSDGQTRLTASVETGASFFADVTFDLKREAFAYIDSQASARTNADFAYMSGVTEFAPLTVAAVSHLYRKDHDLGHTQKLSPTQVLEALQTYKDIGPSIKIAKRFKMVRAPKGIIAAVHYLASKIDKAVADKTFEDFIAGVSAGTDDPVLVARERLRRAYTSPANEFRGGGDRRVRVMLSRMFNYRMQGVRTSKFLLDGGDDWPGDVVKTKKAQ